jgi:hypothetical protein
MANRKSKPRPYPAGREGRDLSPDELAKFVEQLRTVGGEKRQRDEEQQAAARRHRDESGEAA